MKQLRLLLLGTGTLLPVMAWSHEGHGKESPWGVDHYVTNPEHFVQVILIMSLVITFITIHYRVRRRKNQR